MKRRLSKLKFTDLEILSKITNARSIRELSRIIQQDPQNLSKKLNSYENLLGRRILVRSAKGYVLTDFGIKVANLSSRTLNDFQDSLFSNTDSSSKIYFSGRGFLTSFFIKYCYKGVRENFPDLYFEFTDSSPGESERAARSNLITMALSLGDILPGESWISKRVGQCSWGFFVKNGHPLTKYQDLKISDLAKFGLLGTSFLEDNRFLSLPGFEEISSLVDRTIGVQRTDYAKNILLESNYIAYLPCLSVREEKKQNTLIEIRVSDIVDLKENIYVHYHSDLILDKWENVITKSIINEL